jgi:DNA-binding FadR family transcriptional regulator
VEPRLCLGRHQIVIAPRIRDACLHTGRNALLEHETSVETLAQYSLASEAGRAADQEFHATLLSASANPFLESLTSGIGAAVARTTLFKQRHQPLERNPVPDHLRLFEAVRDRKPKLAQQAMTRLVALALRDTTKAASG